MRLRLAGATVAAVPSRPLFGPTRRRRPTGLSQLLAVVAGAALGVVMPRLPVGPLVDSARVFDLLFTVGFGVLGLVSVLFSLLFLVVQWGASTFTPRLRLFRNDPLIWWVFAVAVGLFVYSLTAALSLDPAAPARASVPAVAVIVVVVTLALMRSLQFRAFRSIQLAPTLAAVAVAGNEVIARAYPEPYSARVSGGPALTTGRTVVWTGSPGVLQRLDLPDLVAAATRAGAEVEFSASVGDALWRGRAVAVVLGEGLPDAAVTSAVVLGVERSFDQDPSLAFRLLADIGLRALSSSVNDPATAVQVLDALEPMVGEVSARGLCPSELRDTTGRLRVTVPQPTWDDLIGLSLDDVAVAAAGSPLVLTRLIALLDRLRDAVPAENVASVIARLEHARAELALAQPFVTGPAHR